MSGNRVLFPRPDAVAAAWAAVDPHLSKHHPAISYKRGSGGPKEADALIAGDGVWYTLDCAEASPK